MRAPAAGARRALLAVWQFAAGDDWRTAVGVAAAIGLTAALASASVPAWWVMPLAVVALVTLSLRRAARGERRASR